MHFLLLLGLLGPTFIHATSPFQPFPGGLKKRLVVFGDSTNDIGNGAWEISNHTLPVDPPYYKHMYTNGLNYVMLLKQDLKRDVLGYATGGATYDNAVLPGVLTPGVVMNPVIVPPSVKEQIEEFLAETNVKKSDVFIIGGGVNEASISGFTFTGTQTAALLDARVEQLFNAGARNIILSTLPDLATLPRIKGFPAQIQAKASNYSRQFRDGVLAIAEKWDDRLSIEVVDIWEISNDILAKPEKFGFDPSKMFTPCYPGSYTAFDAPICAGPDRYPWFDLSNPSAAMHRHLARYFKKAIEHL